MATQPTKISGGSGSHATATISTAATGLSDVIDIGGYSLRSIQTSTAWTAANLTFMASAKSSDTLLSVRHTTASLELTYVATLDRAISVDPALFSGYKYVQLRSGTTTTPVAQAAERAVILGLDRIVK